MIRFTAVATLLFVFVAACSDAPSSVTREDRVQAKSLSVGGAALQQRGRRTVSDEFLQLSQEAPGFTGVFLDDAGDLVIAVARDDFSEQSAERVLNWARSFSPEARQKERAKLRRVPYDYATLLERSAVVYSAIRADEHLVSAAIDETRGRIVLGFTSLRAVGTIRTRLSALGVPSDIVEFEQRPQATGDAKLDETVRPMVGGIQIKGHNAAGNCSLGFNVMNWETGTDWYTSPMYFLTAGHCGEIWGTKGAHWYQPGTGQRIGEEFQVASKKVYPAYCPSPSQSPCMLADVLAVKYDSIMTFPDSVAYGNVADVDASRNVIGWFNVQGTLAGGLNGQTVTMVGQVSGKKTGVISRTCEHQNVANPSGGSIWILCQQRANYTAANGDSGAPIFIPYNGSFGTPAIVGVHSSTGGGYRWFSPIGEIDRALNNAYFYW